MNSKLISFIKVVVSIIIMALFVIAIFIIISLNKQNTELNKMNRELTIFINTQEITIDKLSHNNNELNSEIVRLTKANNKLQDDNKLLGTQNQELLVQVKELKNNIAQLEESQKKQIITPSSKDFKSYLPYDAITSKISEQWKLQQLATTNEDGIRCIDEIPMVAVGTGWGVSVGDMALVTCDNGNSFEVLVGDIKDDVHTDKENKTTVFSGCRCEFIVELDKLDNEVRMMGNVAILSEYSGYVVNVEKIG